MSIGKLRVQAPFSTILPLLALLAFAPACAGGSSPGSKGSGGSNGEETGGTSGNDDSGGAGGESSGSGGADSDGPLGSGGTAGESGAGSGGSSGDGPADTGGGTGGTTVPGTTVPVLGCEDCAKYDLCCTAQLASADGGTSEGCMLTGSCNMTPAGITRDFVALGCRTKLLQIAAAADAPAACK